MKNGSLVNVSMMKFSVHSGTQVDAPGHVFDHFYDAGFDVDTLDLQVLNGPALVVDVPRDKNITGPVVEDTKSFLTQVTGESFTHIRRTTNGVAHRLAHFALHIKGSLYWFEEPPDFISDVLYEDCNS
ncbi:hypothetical protein GBA52_026622 [Prunus armeniaca]|nr:hypothetical protein GBA52_026622 [Prunus armeniaca]